MSQQPIDPPDSPPVPSSVGLKGGGAGDAAAGEETPTTAELLEQLRQDRLWLLRQLDSGRWSEWRLDLAALERELGQLLDQIEERRGFS